MKPELTIEQKAEAYAYVYCMRQGDPPRCKCGKHGGGDCAYCMAYQYAIAELHP